jgi:hypothetical protein
MGLATRCLNGSIRIAGSSMGGLLSVCMRRKWLYFPFDEFRKILGFEFVTTLITPKCRSEVKP